jgi:hypothetical protein
MNNDDLADILRGDIKFVDIEAVIDEYLDKLRTLVEPYVDEKRKLHLAQLYLDSKEIWTSEPDWPKGKIKTNRQKFNYLREELWRWKRLKNDLTALAFPDYQDDEFDYRIQSIAIRVVKT